MNAAADSTGILAALRGKLAREGVVTFDVCVRPGARRSAVRGARADGVLRVDIAANPERGRANDALCDFLAGQFHIHRAAVTLLSGHVARCKRVRITSFH